MTTTPNKLLPVDSVAQEKMMWCWAACSQMVLKYLQRPGQLELSLERGWVGGSDEPVPSQGQLVEWRRTQDGKPHIDCSVPPGPNATDAEEDEWYKVCNWGGWPNLGPFNDLVENSSWASTRHVLETRGLRLEADGPLLRIDDKPSDEEKRRLSAEELRQRSDERLRHVAFKSGPTFSQALADAEDCALSWEMLKRLIDEGSPVIFSWRYGSSAGHLMVAGGHLSIPKTKTAEETHWVFVRDSWPPLSGDGYLIPHDYYVKGPGGRHWRDYWIRKVGGTSPYSLPWEKAFVPSPKGPPSPSSDAKVAKKKPPATLKAELEKNIEHAVSDARPKAYEGLAALQAIVEGDDALDMALALGMGVIWMKATARVVADALVAAGLEESEDGVPALDSWEDIDAKKYLGPHDEDLAFFSDGGQPTAIPVFHVSREGLKAWNGDSNKLPIPETPTELVFPVRWPGQTPFELFSTVTVRSASPLSKSARNAGSWQVVNIGRASIMQALGMRKWAKTRGLDSDDPSWLFTREGLTEKLPRILKELGLINAAARQEGPAEWLIGMLTDLRLDKIAWRAASKLSGLRDQAPQRLQRVSDEQEKQGEEYKQEIAERAKAMKMFSKMLALSSLGEWRKEIDGWVNSKDDDTNGEDHADPHSETATGDLELDSGGFGWTELRSLIIGPDPELGHEPDEQGSSVLHKLWPLVLKKGHALEARPSEPSEKDRNDVRALAQAVDKVLEYSRPALLAARIDKENEEATEAGAFLKEARDLTGASPQDQEALRKLAKLNEGVRGVLKAADDLERMATKQRVTQLNELAKAALDGWEFLRRLAEESKDSDLKKKLEELSAAAAKSATAKDAVLESPKQDNVLDELLAQRGSDKEKIKLFIDAVEAGWTVEDLEKAAPKQAATRLDELATAALEGSKILGKLPEESKDGDLEEKHEELKKRIEELGAAAAKRAAAEDAVLKSLKAANVLDELLAQRAGAKWAILLLIDAVEVGWKDLKAEMYSRLPKPSLDAWKLPEYVIDVPELYQQFLVYGDDDIVQAYPEDFYPRPNRVRPKDKVDLLNQLKRLAS